METRQLPAPQQEEQASHHPLVTLAIIGIAVCWLIVFIIGMGLAHGPWAAWWTSVIVGTVGAVGVLASHIHERHKQHMLHQEDVRDRIHHRAMVELAIRNDHSAEHITSTSSFRAISKYMGPTTVNIKDNQLGQAQLPAGNIEQPSLAGIIEDLGRNTLEFAFGYDPEAGELIKTQLQKAVHIQLVGASGQGKSRQATSILTQLVTCNDPEHLQLALIDHEGETSAPFTGLPHVQYVADEPKEAAKIFRALVRELERRDVGKIAFPVLLMFCEEFLNLRRSMPPQYRDQALEDYSTLALRGRKRGMFLFSIGQTAYTQMSIRDAQAQFLSSMAFALKPTAARSAGFTNTPLLNRLYNERKPGQFLLERPAGDSLLLAPYVDSHLVGDLLASESRSTTALLNDDMDEFSEPVESHKKATSEPTRNLSESPLEAKEEQVRQLLLSGTTNKADIIQIIWGARSGSSAKYREADAEYKTIMMQLAQKGQ